MVLSDCTGGVVTSLRDFTQPPANSSQTFGLNEWPNRQPSNHNPTHGSGLMTGFEFCSSPPHEWPTSHSATKCLRHCHSPAHGFGLNEWINRQPSNHSPTHGSSLMTGFELYSPPPHERPTSHSATKCRRRCHNPAHGFSLMNASTSYLGRCRDVIQLAESRPYRQEVIPRFESMR